MISALLFGIFAILLVLGVPIAISLGVASSVVLFTSGKVSSSFIPQGLVTSIDSFPLMAVPFFILAGDLMSQGGLSSRLLNVGKVLFGRYNAGLAIIAVATCMFFGAISGSGPATVAAVGSILLPAMAKDGYRPVFSTSLVASAGSLGVIIPPSIPMVIYAASANVSVTGMFLAGIIPGLIIGLALMMYAWIQARREGVGADATRYTPGEAWAVVWDAKWALIVPVIILGGIYGGIFTPTEAAAIGVIYGLIVGLFVYRELRLIDLYRVFAQSALTTGSVMLIVGAATIFGRVLTIERIPVLLAEAMVDLVSSPLALLMLVNLLLLVVGTFMETLAAIIILTPILLPVAIAMGIDPTHFGIVMIVNLGIGMVTPPLGMNLFIGSKVGNVPLEQLMRGALPFVLVMLVTLALITYLPALSLALPTWVAG
ncbi:C4-dicarboxylate ABC transporter permease [Salipiger aestuarii]|uniref:TRAP transporter large permease protein n=1 Tax=Salipiger aestuarii TaxID=568098 RepID=A0A327XSZ9_9RHOB|nr:TRAP transporter large permease [Salipiger aestuarii]EIE48665.1 TRAP dicarboxylate transporter, DctM subunit [Citreicella sp. 357]KAA8604797.1 C4-dicarboxylate ABC transporter permease [Salipiger aestuarii]KAA8606528.1 C4-dicarboxylate ABC transporter permease [Salipiger aestuarii]KAB2532913.1 C4-dicarboxylate ABC transporter permease [Salipiger aestuarii]RAK11271.1 C4-dicarboxylate transporter DctM subunit [Salipiger aestuarii]